MKLNTAAAPPAGPEVGPTVLVCPLWVVPRDHCIARNAYLHDDVSTHWDSTQAEVHTLQGSSTGSGTRSAALRSSWAAEVEELGGTHWAGQGDSECIWM